MISDSGNNGLSNIYKRETKGEDMTEGNKITEEMYGVVLASKIIGETVYNRQYEDLARSTNW